MSSPSEPIAASWSDEAEPAVRATRRRRALRPAVLEALALLVVAIAGTGMVLDAIWAPSPDATRNPAFRRNWPAWVAAAEPRRDGETLVLLLGNSQGYGREVGDGEIYAARLVPLLQARTGRPARVVNWAVPGGGALDYALATAAAHRLQPDVVVLVTSPGSFGRWTWTGGGSLERSSSDLRYLLADPSIRQHLPARFLDRYLHANDRIDAWLAHNVPLWRYRDLPRSWLVSALPPLRSFEKDGGQERWLYAPGGDEHFEPFAASPTSAALRDVVLETLARLDGRALVVRMPVHSTLQDHHPAWFENVGREAGRRGIESVDLRDALPDDAFVTVSHLDADGHQRLAALLAPLIAP